MRTPSSLAIVMHIFICFLISSPARASLLSDRGIQRGASDSICANLDAKACLAVALSAMGGREKLEAIRTVRSTSIGHKSLVEQSYRQDPFIVAYERDELSVDFANQRLRNVMTLTWPQSDSGQFESKSTLIVGSDGGVYHDDSADVPCSPGDLVAARQFMALGPYRVLLTAITATDLHYAAPQVVRNTLHSALQFTWHNMLVRVLVNPFNGLPDAVETTQQFPDMWFSGAMSVSEFILIIGN